MSETIMKLNEIEDFLNSIPKFSSSGKDAANFDLNRMKKFCNRMGNPQKDFRSVHVAGTNGKGTVCRMLASVYQEAGFKVGLYTSPHLVDFRERFQINAKYVENDLLVEFFDNFAGYIRKLKFTYFEITTAIAFWVFSKQKVDLAVIEVGLGGRLDATNVIDPLVSVITSIGLDHTDILGNTIEKIAVEKGGIIKQNKPVVIGNLDVKARSVIQEIANQKSAELVNADSLQAVYQNEKIILRNSNPPIIIEGKNWKKVDAINTAITYKVTKLVNDFYPINNQQFKCGIESVQNRFSRRAVFEKLLPGYSWYFDGAHNVQSVQSLTMHLSTIAAPEEWTVILSFMSDKLTSGVAELWNNFGNLYIYKMNGERAATVDEMKSFFPNARILDLQDGLHLNQFKSELVIFSGSFYFYSIVSNWMGAIASADQINPSAL